MRHLITLDDLSNFEIRQIFRLADQMRTNLATWSGFCQGKLLATLFYEPSTRTRLSFESAMERLNGRTLGFADPHAASVAKGETIADTARMVTNYADLIVVRHSFAGAARVMARYANIPVYQRRRWQSCASDAGAYRHVHRNGAERRRERVDSGYLRRSALWAGGSHPLHSLSRGSGEIWFILPRRFSRCRTGFSRKSSICTGKCRRRPPTSRT